MAVGYPYVFRFDNANNIGNLLNHNHSSTSYHLYDQTLI